MDFDDFIQIIAVLIIIIICAFVFGGAILGFFLNDIGASQGQHTGYVTAVEFNDNMIWDSTIVYFKTDTQSTQEDKYCINTPNVKLLLEKVAKEKRQVTLHYRNDFWFWRSQCNGGGSIIEAIEELK